MRAKRATNGANGKAAHQVARTLWAMSMGVKDKDLVDALRNERYQRTFTDEHPFLLAHRKPVARFKPVDPEQKKEWEMLAAHHKSWRRPRKRPSLSF